MIDLGAVGLQPAKNTGQFLIHPHRGLRPRGSGQPDAAHIGKPLGLFGRGRVKKQNRGQASEGQHFHARRRAGVVIAIPGNQRAVGKCSGHHFAPPN